MGEAWRLYLAAALLLHVGAWTVVAYWSMWNWEQHPISRSLRAQTAPPHTRWGVTATRLNTEFRSVDKFTAGVHGARVIVTDSWVLKVRSPRARTFFILLQIVCRQPLCSPPIALFLSFPLNQD